MELIAVLRRAAGLLDDASSLRDEIIAVCDRTQNPTYRIAVFGPFNYGKSTLLNALLGEKTLPMDLVPTTGAAITVKYGTECRTRIIRVDGSMQEEKGTDALEQFAVLDEQRRMRKDVAAVEVFCPHPLLRVGLELVDLPGTDDQQAQNDLVQKQLLSADLVIQVLDGRKLMTLAEREHLRDWLLDRGITNVVFVVNFLNLMEAGDRQQVALRLRFLAESFRADLPKGVSNLYQVDALPALRARLKGDAAAAAQTGLPALESALQMIGQQVSEGNASEPGLTRLMAVAGLAVGELQGQIQGQIAIAQSVDSPPKDARRMEIQEKARSLIQQGFNQDVAKLRDWLKPNTLKANYRIGLAQALEEQTTQAWIIENLRPAWYERQKPVVKWVHQACEFFSCPRPVDLWMAFSSDGTTAENSQEQKADPVSNPLEDASEDSQRTPRIAPVAIATGLGWILDGPMGAAVLAGTSHLVNQRGSRNRRSSSAPTPAVAIDFEEQADIYLERFSLEAIANLQKYEHLANRIIQAERSEKTPAGDSLSEARINLMKATLAELRDLLE